MLDLDKATKVKELFLADQTQNVLASAVVDSCCVSVNLASKWQVLEIPVRDNCLEHFKSFVSSDISSFAKLFRQQIRYVRSDSGVETGGQIVSVLRSVEDQVLRKSGRSTEFQQVRDFNYKIRELATLTEFLREARNLFSHDMRTRSDLGWNVAVLGNLLRILEVAVINENMQQTAALTTDKAEELLRSYFDNKRPAVGDLETENVLPEVNSGVSSDLVDYVGRIEDELVSLRDKLPILFQDFTNTFSEILDRKIILPPPDRAPLQVAQGSNAQTVNETPDAEPPDFFVYESPQEDFSSFFTPEGARRELINIGKEFEFIEYGKYWPGVAASILQKPIIFEILRLRCRQIEDVFTSDEVQWRYKRYASYMDKQLELFKPQINQVLQQIVFPDVLVGH
jgi:hypothetical protein